MIKENKRKFLLIRNDNIGDLICTTPAIEALRKKYPVAKIDIVVNSYNYSAIYRNPFVDKIYCYTKPKHKKSIKDKIKAGLGKLKILYEIRKEGYDTVIVFRSGYSKSAEIFSRITNAKYKIGVKNIRGKDDFNIYIPTSANKHEVEFCFDCLKPLRVTSHQEKTLYFVPENYINKYKKFNIDILFHISARIKNNKLSFSKLQDILKKINRKVYITASPEDIDMARRLEDGKNTFYIKTNSLYDLAGAIKNSKIFITLEGGAMHISSALGIKTIALFGVSNISKWHPWGYKELVLQDISKIAENINTENIIDSIRRQV